MLPIVLLVTPMTGPEHSHVTGRPHGDIVNQACFQSRRFLSNNNSAMGYKGLKFEDIIVTMDGAVAVVTLDRASE